MKLSMDSDLEADFLDEIVEDWFPQGILLESLGGDFAEKSAPHATNVEVEKNIKLTEKQKIEAAGVKIKSLKDQESITTGDTLVPAEEMVKDGEMLVMFLSWCD